MKLLITGCGGFIGSKLCESLCKRGDNVIGIDNLNNYYDQDKKLKNIEKLNFSNFIFIKDDLITTNILREHKFDVVVNLGAMAGVRNSLNNPEIYIKTNTEGQIHLLKECVETEVKHFVYASSSSVYGKNKKIPFSENDELNEISSPYALSKLFSEKIAEFYSKTFNITTIGLRFFTVYGPNGRPDMAPYKFLDAIMKDKPIDKYGDGNTCRDYTYIDDIIEGILGAIDNKMNKKCEIYNLGNSYPVSLNNFIEICEKIVGKKAIINQMEEQKGDVPFTYADIEKSKKDLNYNPKIKLEDGLKKMYESFYQ